MWNSLSIVRYAISNVNIEIIFLPLFSFFH
uniref:Uncharacterized protein n=1 Tax=Rhizophora mucronata TaxID=61149 RepID=A0A2P2J068_RHIMU